MSGCDFHAEFNKYFCVIKVFITITGNSKKRQAICDHLTLANHIIPKAEGHTGLESNYCDTNCIADQFHIILECKKL